MKQSTRTMLSRAVDRNANLPRCLVRIRKSMAATIWQKKITGARRLPPLWM